MTRFGAILLGIWFLPLFVSAQTVNLGPHTLKVGELNKVEVPLSGANQRLAARGSKTKVDTAELGILVPQGFDPAKSWPVLVVSATDGSSSIQLMDSFKEAALFRGWVVIAADGQLPPKHDNTDWRYAMLSQGLELMATNWPESKKWKYVCAGFSGGGKRSAYIAALMMKDHYDIAGMFMSGVNQDMATMALNEHHPNASTFRRVPIFLSAGTEDSMASPVHQEKVRNSMVKSGFKKIRLETFAGGHRVQRPHIADALEWFTVEK